MFLGNGSVQINFLLDHVKVLLCTDHATGEVFLTLISGPRPDSDELISKQRDFDRIRECLVAMKLFRNDIALTQNEP